ncbi:MAG: glutamate--tRNA ligase [Clostridiales bacterium]|nr:glutamate--tRNA ligase [Clostridiales bacterium]
MSVRTRFAPSPTGYMHLGNLRTALYTYLYARKEGGTFILRIEDTDQEREVPGAVQIIYNSLKTAGLTHDEGPDIGGPVGPYVQSERKDTYLPYAKQLVESGHAYYCFCTKERLEEARAEAEKKGESFKYDKHCLHLSKEEIQAKLDAGEPYVIRQNIPTTGKAGFDDVIYGHVEVDCETLDDNILIKADGLPTYNFANVIDDHLMGITHVMRGNEYLSSAPKYNLLYEALGWEPPKYVHLTPVMANAQRKLSKRKGDPSFEDLLSQGYLTEAVINYMVLLGWSPRGEREFFTLKELEEVFDLEGLSKSPSIFDTVKLNWFNAEYIRRLSPETYLEHARPWLNQMLDETKFDYKRLCELLQSRTEVFNQLPEMVDFLKEMPAFDNELYTHKKMKTNPEVALDALTRIRPIIDGVTEWTEEKLHDAVMEAITEFGMKNGQMLWPLRIAISGKMSTPGGAFEIAYLLGKEETMKRLDASIAQLQK